jgi:hypothetical protein
MSAILYDLTSWLGALFNFNTLYFPSIPKYKAQQSYGRSKLNYSCNIWENQFQTFCFSRLNKIPF